MMSRSRAAVVSTVLLALFSPAMADDTAPQTYDLKYRFRTGEEVRYQVSHVASIETTMAGTSQTADTVSKSVKLWRVADSDPAAKTVFEHSVESVDMRHTISGRKEVSYNSQTDEHAPPGYEDAAKAVGVPLTVVTIDPRGNVLHRAQKLQQAAAAAMNTQILYPLPAKPVPVGYVWTVPNDVEVMLEAGATKKIQTRQRFELLEVNDGIAKIGLEMQVLTPVHNPKIEAQLMQRLFKGTLQFDIAAGRIISQQLDVDQRVLAFSGPDSSMHYLSRFTEKLVTAAGTASAKPSISKPAAANSKPTKSKPATASTATAPNKPAAASSDQPSSRRRQTAAAPAAPKAAPARQPVRQATRPDNPLRATR